MMEQTQLLILIDEDTKKKVRRLARLEGKTTSTVVRELLAEYIREKDIVSYIDGLWDRIGVRMRLRCE
jgi:predicted DNA-binding protein